MMQQGKIRVWDPVVRLGHWSLVVLFATAYISGEWDWGLHVYAGYGVLAIVAFRLLWGLVGTRHARFTGFLRDWHGLDAFDQLQAIPALSLALAAAGPGARVWFEPLYELAAGVELPWRHGAVAAVAQGCLRAGELERALTLYGRIGEPSEQLRALLEALGLVSGPQAAADPILVSALLASVGRQTLPVLAWQAHLAAAMALRRRGEPEAALAAWAEGLIHLL